jgi:3',5'-cyclic AMP phosphodiesterase CpdA
MTTQVPIDRSRRAAMKCMAFGGAGTLFVLSGGVLTPRDLAFARSSASEHGHGAGIPLFVQVSDTHIGFNKEANPDVAATLKQTIERVNAMPRAPELVIHTGDITHLARPAEFDTAQQLLSSLKVTELHTVPGEHDVADAGGTEYFNRYGKPSGNLGYYSFDHHGVHFVALTNVLNFKPGGLGMLGLAQLEWLEKDLGSKSSSTPIVVFAHMPLWTVYEPWGWGTGDAERALHCLRGFGSVTILNGHIHQIVQKTEGTLTFHTARSTAYPQPAPGAAPAPGPLKVPQERLAGMLGLTTVAVAPHPRTLSLTDTALDS